MANKTNSGTTSIPHCNMTIVKHGKEKNTNNKDKTTSI